MRPSFLVCLSSLLALPSFASEPATASPESTLVSDRPSEVNPTRNWDIKHLHLAVRLDIESGTVTGHTVHTIAPLVKPSSWLVLDQVGLDISSVTVDGEATEFIAEEDSVRIAVKPNAEHEVRIDYSVQPRLGIHFRRPGEDGARYTEVWTQGEDTDHRYWFPSWDHPSDRFTFSSDITVPEGLTALSNGTLKAKSEAKNGEVTWSYQLDQRLVNYLVAIAVGEYREIPHEGSRVPVLSYVHEVYGDRAHEGLDEAVPILNYFEDVLAMDYPFPIYRQVAVQSFMYGGMENSSTTILADSLIAEHPWDRTRGTEGVVAHELAHQWFGDSLTCYSWREMWLNEGFATYWTLRWMEQHYGEEYAAARWWRHLESARGQRRPMAKRAWAAKDDDSDSSNVYNRGASFLRMLEKRLGREVFDAAIQNYLDHNEDGLVETADLRREFEAVSGEHLGWMFDQWVFRAGAPTLDVSHTFTHPDGDKPGQLLIRAKISKDQVGTWFAQIPVAVGTSEGVQTHTIELSPEASDISIPMETPPAWILVDPDRSVIVNIDQTQSPEAWLAALKGTESWYGRLVALRRMGDAKVQDSEEFWELVSSWIQDDALDPYLRARIARLAGAWVSDLAAKSFLQQISVKDSAVRSAVIGSLGKQADSDSLRTTLSTVWRRDEDPSVRSAALSAIATLEPKLGLRLARSVRSAPTEVRSTALRIIGKHGETSDASRLLKGLTSNEHRWVRGTAMRGLSELIKRDSDNVKLKKTAVSSILPLLSSTDIRVTQSAIGVLGGIDSEAARRELRAFAQATTVPELREYAEEQLKKK